MNYEWNMLLANRCDVLLILAHTVGIQQYVFVPTWQPRNFCQQILLFIAISLYNCTLYLYLLELYAFTAFREVYFIYIFQVLSVVLRIFLVSGE